MTLEWDARGGGEVLTSLHSAGLQLTAKRHRGSTEGMGLSKPGPGLVAAASVAVVIGLRLYLRQGESRPR